MIKEPKCYKNHDSPTSIGLFLANAPRSLQSTCVLETGLSDFRLMNLTVTRKLQSRAINYRSYESFSNKKFKSCLVNELRKEDFVHNNKGFECFFDISVTVLNKHALWKNKFARANEMLFMTKDLSKEIIERLRLRNEFLKNKSPENRMLHKQQRNYCASLLRKTKIKYYANLN